MRSIEETVAGDFQSETVSGDDDERRDSEDGTTSGGDVVEARLAAENQCVQRDRQSQVNNLPVSSRPPAKPPKRPNEVVGQWT